MIKSIFTGFLISKNITPMIIPLITMPYYLKLTVLAVTLLGFILAIELKLKFDHPSNLFKFSPFRPIFQPLYTFYYSWIYQQVKISTTITKLNLIRNKIHLISDKTFHPNLIKNVWLNFLLLYHMNLNLILFNLPEQSP